MRKGKRQMTRMTQKSDLDGLSLLGRGAKPAKKLETFPSHHAERDYIITLRNEGAFHEHVTNVILDDLVAVLEPRWCKVTADFAVRGGMAITVEAEAKR